ncbi:MAG: hypothetical protein KJ607_07040, partial [Bacteroidetes bacterium]|nr:hypothetical protein [Bacteroidota bacterium]
VDMLKTIRLVEGLTGEKLVFMSDMDLNPIESESKPDKSLLEVIEEQQKQINDLKRRIEELEKLSY